MKKKILIVDSDLANLKVLGKCFSEQSFTVLVAITTEQAIKIAQVKMPDIILSVDMTPIIDGEQLNKALKNKKQTKAIPTLFIADKKNKKKVELICLKSGCDYLLKPYTSKELLNKVNKLTESNNKKATKVASNNNRATIMVVDDIELNRNLIEDFLSNGPFKTIKSSGGKDSIKKIKEKKIDLILLDIEMPVMNGWKTIELYKEMKLKIPVLAMSAHYDKDFEEKCIQSGFKGNISKPISRSKLNNSLKKLLPEVFTKEDTELSKKITVGIKKKKVKSNSYIDISNLLRTSANDLKLQTLTFNKFSENINQLEHYFTLQKLSVSTVEKLRRELHSFVNLAHYFCTPEVIKNAKKEEVQLKNNSAFFWKNKDRFALLLRDIKNQLKDVKI
jgi:CheY-like chemotaxis protein